MFGVGRRGLVRRWLVRRWLVATLLGAAVVMSAGTAVEAHVNRQIGPYTILVILVEEPTFEDNHAGFEFWVRRDEQPILGLERTIHAEATGHGQRIGLNVPAMGGAGFYVLDRTLGGAAFDPLGGGPWSLHLWGDIHGTPLDEELAVTFPSYPRIGVLNPAGGSAAPIASPPSPWTGLPLVALLAAGLAIAAVFVARRIRPRPGQPTPEPPR